MIYKNAVCDGCGKELLEDEDIVVCPRCGTPQHRECYQKNNCCVNESLHGEGFVWQASPQPEEAAPKPTDPENSAPVPVFYNGDGMESVFMRGVAADPNAEFDGVKVRDAALYVQNGANRYIKKFMRSAEKKSKLSWNWGAFFFSQAWFFFRKMYKVGFAFLGVILALNVAMTAYMGEKIAPYSDEVNELTEQMYALITSSDGSEAAQQQAEQLSARSQELSKKILPYTTAHVAVTFLLPGTAAALLADRLYKKKMISDLSFARKSTDDRKIFSFSVIRRGGVSFFAAFAAIIAQYYLPDLIFTAINYFIH